MLTVCEHSINRERLNLEVSASFCHQRSQLEGTCSNIVSLTASLFSSVSDKNLVMFDSRVLLPTTASTKTTQAVNAFATILSAEQYWTAPLLAAQTHLSALVMHETGIAELSQMEEER
ncbi:uncharacterized protein LAESUDRAFT_733051 [Laetiporus sulphureus 93-53]|uniref:Uncharacterized protein n=1 Tax=Laetiporus sulphureus 93-53 TaxID=1314785 RepID=A0A165AS12_9APHY|nr:uncharacterized protein LAESUDRAFT_733077 [Laetiporus sulphureus 93-53]XP_040757289.1 uncharacterized protein LAESUDRAFT_733072 [Laetiporus sulphureus 93-53]XP_040757336.1 uncharacterized protein LAESUDRAFT_733051 [Laetiporus sulphureus 93-53]KZS99547.1 hypothetical protein LAESUDRAFT_733077 [Laetiporus sulphureus 93-53]KZS99548.1 hypothetical protein LAESUDRAFT_733072 [Laetiporus sulphureus 93-53]KZS99595.1 hypothetical protein LAESUDRAFT_733051 [Laetiporus sulphureus 93-53]